MPTCAKRRKQVTSWSRVWPKHRQEALTPPCRAIRPVLCIPKARVRRLDDQVQAQEFWQCTVTFRFRRFGSWWRSPIESIAQIQKHAVDCRDALIFAAATVALVS